MTFSSSVAPKQRKCWGCLPAYLLKRLALTWLKIEHWIRYYKAILNDRRLIQLSWNHHLHALSERLTIGIQAPASYVGVWTKLSITGAWQSVSRSFHIETIFTIGPCHHLRSLCLARPITRSIAETNISPVGKRQKTSYLNQKNPNFSTELSTKDRNYVI